MTWFNPFRILVPSKDKPHLVASRSYVSYGKAELQDKLDRNPYSYLHVINPAGTGKAPFKRGSEAFTAWSVNGSNPSLRRDGSRPMTNRLSRFTDRLLNTTRARA